jgi:type IV secretory pathway component VirB8
MSPRTAWAYAVLIFALDVLLALAVIWGQPVRVYTIYFVDISGVC